MSRLLTTTPREDGFRMPGEFEPHAGCWMLFPERNDVWRGGAKPAQRAFARVADAISRFEPVTVCASARQYNHARTIMPDAVRVVEMSSNDAWIRDCGPSFVVNHAGEVRGVDWTFNAWGGLDEGLYFPWDLDDQVARKVLEIERVDRYKAPITLEGGGIHVDGEGTLITTRDAILNRNRNPGMSQADAEAILRDYLNVEKVIWLEFDAYDETDGHVDGVCAFVSPGRLLLSWTDDPDHPDYDICRASLKQLQNTTDAKGRTFEIQKLPVADPTPLSVDEAASIDIVEGSYPRVAGEGVFGGYINFYIANGGIVVPLFDDPNDDTALDILAESFPDREVVGIEGGREISLGGGNVHCITQQQPRG